MNWASLYPQALAAVATKCAIAPSKEGVAAAVEILKKHNTRLAPRTLEVASDVIIGSILSAWRVEVAEHITAATEAFFGYFQQRVRGYADARPLLLALGKRDVPVGVLTDVPYGMPREFVLRDIAAAELGGLCGPVLTSVEVGVRKPEPQGYIKLAGVLGVEPEHMMYVGNEPKDMAGANAAGVFPILIDRDGHGRNHGQRATISTLAHLPDLLRPPM